MRALICAAFAVATCSLAAPARAQIVNVQGSLAKEPEPGWSGVVTGGVDWHTGNTDLLRLWGAGSAMFRAGPWLALALARAEYIEAEDVEVAEKTFEHLRVRRDVTCRLLWEAFAQHEYDAFRRLSVRAVAGAGPALRLLARADASITAGLAYMVEHERRSTLAGVADSGARAWYHRASGYLTGNVRLDDRVTATQTVYVQPRLDEVTDVMVLSETSVETKLGARLALINSFVLAYDATPAETVEARSTSLRLSVSWTF